MFAIDKTLLPDECLAHDTNFPVCVAGIGPFQSGSEAN